MPKPPLQASASGDDRNLVSVDENYVAPSFEDRLNLFWSEHSKTVIAAVVVVLLAVVANGAYGFFKARRASAAGVAYAAAKTDDQLRAFVADYPSLPVTGLAQLRLADDAYSAGNYAAAQSGYAQAADALGATTFGWRARLGAAVALLQSGKAADGETALKRIFADTAASKPVRAEAGYHLAELAADAGRVDEATSLVSQISTIDPEGQWSERAMILQTRLPVAPAPKASTSAQPVEASPAVSFKTTPTTP